jgi:hypothetical protein
MTTGTTSPESRGSPIAAAQSEGWDVARVVWDDIVAMFDSPQGLAEHGWMIRADHARLTGYLRALTALVQRLVLIIALRLDVPQPVPRTPRPRVRHGRILVRSYFHKWPETWPTSVPMPIAATNTRPRAAAPRHAPDKPAMTVAPLWGAAQRLEALRRLIADPMPCARRLARRLARRRADASLPELPAGLSGWRPPASEEAVPYLVVRALPEAHAAAEAAFVQWRMEPE